MTLQLKQKLPVFIFRSFIVVVLTQIVLNDAQYCNLTSDSGNYLQRVEFTLNQFNLTQLNVTVLANLTNTNITLNYILNSSEISISSDSSSSVWYNFNNLTLDTNYSIVITNETDNGLVYSCLVNTDSTEMLQEVSFYLKCLPENTTHLKVVPLFTNISSIQAYIIDGGPNATPSYPVGVEQGSGLLFGVLNSGYFYKLKVDSFEKDGITFTSTDETITCSPEIDTCKVTSNADLNTIKITSSGNSQGNLTIQMSQNTANCCDAKLNTSVAENLSEDNRSFHFIGVNLNESFIFNTTLKTGEPYFKCSIIPNLVVTHNERSVPTETSLNISTEFNSTDFTLIAIAINATGGQTVNESTSSSYIFQYLQPDTEYLVAFTYNEIATGVFYNSLRHFSTNAIISPTTFQVNSLSKTTMNVSWGYPAEGEAERFSIICSPPDCETSNLGNISSNLTEVIVTNLRPNETYTLNLTAHIGVIKSNALTLQNTTLPVPDVAYFLVLSKNQTSIELNWNFTDNSNEYGTSLQLFCFLEDKAFCSTYLDKSQTSEVITNLTSGELYKFEIRAEFNHSGTSYFSETNRTVEARSELYQPDLDKLDLSINNTLTLPVVDCGRYQVFDLAQFLWYDEDNETSCNFSSNSASHSDKNFTINDSLLSCSGYSNTTVNANFTVNPFDKLFGNNSALYGNNLCVQLILFSGSEHQVKATNERRVPLYPDRVSKLECEESTTSSLKFFWRSGKGHVDSYSYEFLLVGDVTQDGETFEHNFTNLEHGTQYTLRVLPISNGLRGPSKIVSCITDVEEPLFNATSSGDETYSIRISTHVNFSNNSHLFIDLAVYSIENVTTQSTASTCKDQLNSLVSVYTSLPQKSNYENFDVPSSDVKPGGSYCVQVKAEVDYTDNNGSRKSNWAVQLVNIPPAPPLISIGPSSTNQVTVEVSMQNSSLFEKITYISDIVQPPTQNFHHSSEPKTWSGIGNQDVTDLMPGIIYNLTVTLESKAGLSANGTAMIQTKPPQPKKTFNNQTAHSCSFNVSADDFVTNFSVEYTNKRIDEEAMRGNNSDKWVYSFNIKELLSGADYNFTITSISNYYSKFSQSLPLYHSCKTDDTHPSKVSNLSIVGSVGKGGEYEVLWGPPEIPNGVIQGYNIAAIWSRPSTIRSFPGKHRVMNVSQKATQEKISFYVPEGYTLSVTVYAFNNELGYEDTKSISRPVTAAPSLNDDTQDYVLLQSTTKSTITIALPCDLYASPPENIFDADAEGKHFAEYYRFRVSQGNSNYSLTPKYFPNSCPQSSNSRSKRSSAGSWTYKIGDGAGCENGDVDGCNKELQEDQTYSVELRAHSSANNFDTLQLGQFQTQDSALLSATALIGILIGMVLLVFVIALVVFVVVNQRRKRSEVRKNSGEMHRVCQTCWNSVEFCHCDDLTKVRTQMQKPIKFDEFRDEYNRLMENDKRELQLEFQQINDEMRALSERLPKRTAIHPEFRQNNRFGDIYPFDHSLVKLSVGYINANFISGETREREYIATQGPMEHTQSDFWRMVWEYNVKTIVMLCLPVESRPEGPRVACHEYWPLEAEKDYWKGEYCLKLIETKEEEFWIKRTISVQKVDERSMDQNLLPAKVCVQYNYTKWEDKKAPNWEELKQFIKTVREDNCNTAALEQSSPIVVHCSAGVGRTGTFIALDRMLQQLFCRDEFDIKGLVVEMRTTRVLMVQTLIQYSFIHDVAVELTDSLETPLDTGMIFFAGSHPPSGNSIAESPYQNDRRNPYLTNYLEPTVSSSNLSLNLTQRHAEHQSENGNIKDDNGIGETNFGFDPKEG